jgi:YVTN family beta-propeller protein
MIYSHTVSVYNRDFQLVKTIPDGVDLASFGISGHPGISQGGPVEAAFTPDGAHVYVSNYSMYGSNWPREGHDTCSPSSGYDTSTVYRIDVKTLAVDQVIAVGVVPKFLEVSPDGRRLVVSNWCSYSDSVIDTATGKEIARVPTGPYPRGIAISPDSKIAYIAVMGGTYIRELDLTTNTITSTINGVGNGPRHLVLSPDGKTLYATLNGDGRVVKIDVATHAVSARVATGSDPRSMAISKDGRFLYVVNYFSGTMSKLRTSDFAVVQSTPTDQHPIGVTVDSGTGEIWVACYGGTIEVFRDNN